MVNNRNLEHDFDNEADRNPNYSRSNKKTSEDKLYPDKRKQVFWWLICPYQHNTIRSSFIQSKKPLVCIFIMRNKAQKWSHRKFTKQEPFFHRSCQKKLFFPKKEKNKTTAFFSEDNF